MNALIAASIAAISGLVFGIGLIASGMTDPAKVKGFLDLAGAWDPSLGLLFSVGWGVAGYCPGPALVALGGGSANAGQFVLAMLASMALHDRVLKKSV